MQPSHVEISASLIYAIECNRFWIHIIGSAFQISSIWRKRLYVSPTVERHDQDFDKQNASHFSVLHIKCLDTPRKKLVKGLFTLSNMWTSIAIQHQKSVEGRVRPQASTCLWWIHCCWDYPQLLAAEIVHNIQWRLESSWKTSFCLTSDNAFQKMVHIGLASNAHATITVTQKKKKKDSMEDDHRRFGTPWKVHCCRRWFCVRLIPYKGTFASTPRPNRRLRSVVTENNTPVRELEHSVNCIG